MAMKEKIAQDLKAAMKSGDKLRLETLRTISAALMEREIQKRGTGTGVTPEDEVAVLTSSAKKRRESIELFRNGGRPELAEQEEKELQIIQEYLPRQLGPEDVAAVVRQVIADTGAAGAGDFGKVMPLVMKQLKGKADGRMIQETVKSLLGNA